MNYTFRTAAAWLTRNDWRQSPAYWAEQARIRYQLTDQETGLLLYNMKLQLGN